MQDYSKIGLDKNLRSVNSGTSGTIDMNSSYSFQGGADRDIIIPAFIPNASIGSAKIGTAAIGHAQIGTAAISDANIGTLSFGVIHGGTAILGGTVNGNGVLSVLNNTGAEVVRADSNGITVQNGSIVIQNSSGGTVISSNGLNSLTNFPNGNIFNGASNLTTTSTSYVDVTGGGTITNTVTGGTSVCLIYMMANGFNSDFIFSDGANQAEIAVYDSFTANTLANLPYTGFAVTRTVGGTSFFETVGDQLSSRLTSVKMSPGTHDLKLQFRALNGGTAYLDAFEIGIVVLGDA